MSSPTAPPVPEKTTLDLSQDSATQALYRAAIGPLNRDYYLPLFSGFEITSKIALQWNTAASLYTLNWMVFRRLWRAALLYVGALAIGLLLVFGVGRAMFHLPTELELGLAILILILSFVVPGLLGNTWLHSDCRQRMAQALNQTTSLQQACDRLAAQSSSRNRFLGLIAINVAAISVVTGHLLTRNDVPEIKDPPPLPITQTAPPAPTPLPVLPEASPAVPAALQPEPAPAASAPTVEPIPTPQPPPPEPAPRQPAATVIESTPAPTVRSKSVRPTTTAAFYVNVGLFANEDNANKAHQRLKDAGLTVQTDTLNMSKGERFRVRVGPFDNRAGADKAARAVRALGLDAIVHQP
jgi:cell division septation protein DedD